MKVLLLNGSRRKEGCTYTALCEVAQVLEQEGVETEILFAGDPSDEAVAAAAEAMKTADGLVVGSPVYWASPSGEIVTFLDKFAAKAGASLAHKPAAAVASARRAGTTATLDVLHKYFEYFEMPLVASCYWPMVHGGNAEQAALDEEGCQIMRNLGHNMAWILRCIEAGAAAGITAPQAENDKRTNFIR